MLDTTTIITLVVSIVCSVLASSGFWAYLQNREHKDSAERKMLIGLGHDRIMWLGMGYVTRGYITKDEYENLHDYLYLPYRECGGNGSAEHVMDQVKKLPVKAG